MEGPRGTGWTELLLGLQAGAGVLPSHPLLTGAHGASPGTGRADGERNSADRPGQLGGHTLLSRRWHMTSGKLFVPSEPQGSSVDWK